MRELVFTCAMAFLGGGCVNVVSHFSEYDAAPAKPEAGPDAEAGPPVQCASGAFWTGGNAASAAHFPGRPCNGNGCHTAASKTVITMGGTIYAGEHDVDDCNGVDTSGYAIVPVDPNDGTELTPRMILTGAGNFYTSKVFAAPYKVKVIHNGKETLKKVAISDGNCNSCHSAEGKNMASGRIVAP